MEYYSCWNQIKTNNNNTERDAEENEVITVNDSVVISIFAFEMNGMCIKYGRDGFFLPRTNNTQTPSKPNRFYRGFFECETTECQQSDWWTR